ncbi:conjugal transfer pilus assembly protein TraF [Novimethylophilus kurashikiensis]|uniref:Conjugal transfer pilus assembly protein TraF n=1 Tax=Novimethylophilus kurashikiensis TaxID=1825523 RepID=A0A2R5F893_9PROT|nr:conjugal transfer protein TraF [Novimethylophilus kurashikiensis]GBG14417.1 conjugal transfer pilus assembly protein TraF [Novimethylophilus kurashikiensis]
MKFIVYALSVAAMLIGSSLSHADNTQPGSGSDDINRAPARQGWHWYVDPKPEEKPEEDPEPPKPEAPKAEEKEKQPIVVISGAVKPEDKCKTKDTWDANCGFVDPGDDFDFQAKERDSLLQMMSLRPDKPEAVEAAQRYMKWVVGKASQAANMWYFNMVQKPDLDPTVKNPISEVGIALASRATQANQYEYFRIIREEGGILFFFSRSDCQFCHDQAPYTRRVARTMGLRVINIPLDGKCLPGFEGDDCGDNIKPEQVAVLQVQVVPSLFLFVPSNTWIRLGTGMVSDSTILSNTVNFFSAYRAAMLAGLDNSSGARPAVTFDPELNARPTGTVAADGSKPIAAPDRERMLELMGYNKKKTK